MDRSDIISPNIFFTESYRYVARFYLDVYYCNHFLEVNDMGLLPTMIIIINIPVPLKPKQTECTDFVKIYFITKNININILTTNRFAKVSIQLPKIFIYLRDICYMKSYPLGI